MRFELTREAEPTWRPPPPWLRRTKMEPLHEQGEPCGVGGRRIFGTDRKDAQGRETPVRDQGRRRRCGGHSEEAGDASRQGRVVSLRAAQAPPDRNAGPDRLRIDRPLYDGRPSAGSFISS